MANMDRLATAIDAATSVMAEAVEDIKWLRSHEDPEVAAKADELAKKLEDATLGLKGETDVTGEPKVEETPAPVEEPVVETPTEVVTE